MRHILAENFYAAAQLYNRPAMNTATPQAPAIASHWPLQALNTFGIAATARAYLRMSSSADLKAVRANPALSALPRLVLGGGSNIVLSGDFDGLVLHLVNQGKMIVSEDDTHIIVSAQAGENWHEFVQWTLEQNLPGLENLSLIPGSVGAAPIQNIGAYGSELKDFFYSLTYFDFSTGEVCVLDREACCFGYRDSIFKREKRGQYFIVSVQLKLSKNAEIKTQYGDIQATLDGWGIEQPTIHDISKAVIQIRKSKLPNPAEIGNCGSFFKNPVVSSDIIPALQSQFPDIKTFPAGEGLTKVPAGWLIEKAGWKGFRRGDVGVHAKQALVLVNYGNGTGQEVIDLAHEIQADVLSKFGIALEMEVNAW